MSGVSTVPPSPPAASPAVNGLGTLPAAPASDTTGSDAAPLFAELLRSQISGRFSAKADTTETLEATPASDASGTEAAATPVPADALAALMPLLFAQMAQPTQPASAGTAPRTEGGNGKTVNAGVPTSLIASTHGSATPADSPTLQAAGSADANSATPKAATISLIPANVATEDATRTLPESHGHPPTNTPFEAVLASAQNLAGTPATYGRDGTNRPPALQIEAPLGAPGWDREVGDKLTWVISRQESHATLVLTPPQLGRIEIAVSLNGDQANAVFASQNPAVREALEAALPRLRETLADAGINLGQAQVGSDAPPPQGEERRDNSGPRPVTARDAVDAGPTVAALPAVSQWISSGRGMVDTFA
ncbi:MAG: flagellar hook-length control protein FliK [Rhodocyclaceae bacterium]|nr:flagellar hook-length control protein FliK [Rhodocyclaceae bacterium]